MKRCWEVCVRPVCLYARMAGEGRGADLDQGFSPLNFLLRGSLGLREKRQGIVLPCLFEMGSVSGACPSWP